MTNQIAWQNGLVHSNRNMRRQITTLLFAFVLTISAQSLHAQNSFTDKFELKPFWTIFEQNGSVGLSSNVSHGGKTSLVLTSRDGGQRYIWVTHTFPTQKKGTLSVWFYDTAPGSETLYAGIYANYNDPNGGFAVNVADWNSTHYVWGGPGTGETSTSVARTNGWHEFKLQLTATGFKAFIDGTLVGEIVGDFFFKEVRLQLSGPVWRPNATFYFDDFKFRATS